MKKGYGGCCRLLYQNAESAVYEYTVWKEESKKIENLRSDFDGRIIIEKDSLVLSEKRTSIKRSIRGGRTVVETPVPVVVNYFALFADRKIVIENCSRCWKLKDGKDFIAIHLVFGIYDHYQNTEILPGEIVYE